MEEEQQQGSVRYIPIQEHPLWGTALRYRENFLPAEVARSLVDEARQGTANRRRKLWQDGTRLGRMVASFTFPESLESISYYEAKIQPIQEWPTLRAAFDLASQQLDEWLPVGFVPRQPNYVLANWYSSPLANARWHQDVPEPIADWIFSISLGAARMFYLQAMSTGGAGTDFEPNNPVYYISLPPNSALLMGPGINSTHIHCIPPCQDEKEEKEEAEKEEATNREDGKEETAYQRNELKQVDDEDARDGASAPEDQAHANSPPPHARFTGPRLNLTFRYVIPF
ncbi:hypothetical protein QOT17_000278 [Balamuthia mandrillaris]